MMEALPEALVGLVTDKLLEDPTDWAAWKQRRDDIYREMAEEPCECGSSRTVWRMVGKGAETEEQRPSTRAGAEACVACEEWNEASLIERAGPAPRVVLQRRVADALSWDAVCRGSRVPEAAWHTLLLEDHRLRKRKHPDNKCLATPEQAMAAIGLSAKQTLRRCQADKRDLLGTLRTREHSTVQQVVDVHRALLLDDDAAFLALARARPRILLDHVATGSRHAAPGPRANPTRDPENLTLALALTLIVEP